jgi:hypothetical protein
MAEAVEVLMLHDVHYALIVSQKRGKPMPYNGGVEELSECLFDLIDGHKFNIRRKGISVDFRSGAPI